jgi:hypothetical protein
MENKMYSNFIKMQEKKTAMEVLHQTHFTMDELKTIYPSVHEKQFKSTIVKPVYTIETMRPMFPSVVVKY